MNKYAEYVKRLEEEAAKGVQFRAVDGDIYDMLSTSREVSGDAVENIMEWAENAGVMQGTKEWAETLDAARIVRKYRMAEYISLQQEALSLLEAQESGDD